MYYSRKRLLEDLPLEATDVWLCSSDGCKGWMRDNFAFSDHPVCLLCHSPMVKGVKNLPLLVNTCPNSK